MASAPTPKILRIALVQGSKITEERLFKRRTDVTLGQDAKSTFVVPPTALSGTHTVFEFRGNQYSLVLTEQMQGSVWVGNADVEFAALRAQGLAKKRGNVYVYPLSEAARGKVTLGDLRLLFQFVQPPPEPAKTELPPVVKGSLWRSMDQLFVIILACSLLVHFSGATFIACQPPPVERELSLDELPDRFARLLEAPKPSAEAQGGGDDKKEAKKGDDGKKGEKPAPAGDPGERKAAMQKAVASKGLLKILGSAGGGGGAFEDVLGTGTGAGDIASALAGAGGVGIATADAIGAGGPKGGGSGAVAGIGDLGTSGGGNVNLGAKGDAKISGRMQESAPEVESSSVDPQAIARYVNMRKSAIVACYERELKRNPQLKGRILVRFTITEQGRASDIDIDENTMRNDAVASCIRSVIRTWVFPFKPDSEVPVAYPFVFSPAS